MDDSYCVLNIYAAATVPAGEVSGTTRRVPSPKYNSIVILFLTRETTRRWRDNEGAKLERLSGKSVSFDADLLGYFSRRKTHWTGRLGITYLSVATARCRMLRLGPFPS